MTDPTPAPDDSTGPERRSWETQIEALLECSRRQTQPNEAGPPPAWLPQAVQLLGGLVHASMVAHTEQATSTVRAQLNEERRRRTQAQDELGQLRDTIRTYLAEIVASGAGIDRHDANEALRGWGIDTLPAQRLPSRHLHPLDTAAPGRSDDVPRPGWRRLDFTPPRSVDRRGASMP